MSLRTELEKLPREVFANEKISFRAIREEDDLAYAIFDCRLTEEQKELVNPAGFSIGRAFLRPDDNYPCVICNSKKERVGFINLAVWLGDGDGYSWSYYVDSGQQGKGYGKSAAELAIRLLKAVDRNKMIKLSTEKGNARAQQLYLSLGLRLLDELDGDDLVFGL